MVDSMFAFLTRILVYAKSRNKQVDCIDKKIYFRIASLLLLLRKRCTCILSYAFTIYYIVLPIQDVLTFADCELNPVSISMFP